MPLSVDRRRRNLVSWVALCLMATACELPWTEKTQEPTIVLAGTVDKHETDLAFRVGGRVIGVTVEEGARIQHDQVVARLDPEDYRLAARQAEAEANAARATLAALKAGTRKQEIRAGEAELASARAEFNFAQAEVRRFERLVGDQLAAQEQLDQARRQLKVTQAAVEEARQRLKLLREGPRKENIQRAQAEYQARLAALATARQQLSYTDLTSPVAGVVMLRMAEPGDTVATGQSILRVALDTRPWVRAYLNETDLARVRLGQAAEVRVDGIEKRFQGHLAFIADEAEFTPKKVETRELRVGLVYRIKVSVEDPEGVLKIGMPADVILRPRAPHE